MLENNGLTRLDCDSFPRISQISRMNNCNNKDFGGTAPTSEGVVAVPPKWLLLLLLIREICGIRGKKEKPLHRFHG